MLLRKEKVRRDTSPSYTLLYIICVMRPAEIIQGPLASLFSQWDNTETCSNYLQSPGFVKDRTGERRENSAISEASRTEQDSVFPPLKGKSRRGEVKGRDLQKNILLFPVKLDYLHVQMSVKEI